METAKRRELLIEGYIRNHYKIQISLDIIGLCIAMYGDGDSIYFRIFGDDFKKLMDINDETKIESTPAFMKDNPEI